jgi:hypothetical protein
VSGFEPLTCRLQEVRPRAPSALAAAMARAIALTAHAALGLSDAPFHESFHADGRQCPMVLTECSDQNPPQRRRNLTWSTTGQSNRSLHCRIGPHLDQGGSAALRRARTGLRPWGADPARCAGQPGSDLLTRSNRQHYDTAPDLNRICPHPICRRHGRRGKEGSRRGSDRSGILRA